MDSVIQKGTDKQKKAATIQDTGHTDTGNTINAQTGTIHAGTSHAIASLLYPGVLGWVKCIVLKEDTFSNHFTMGHSSFLTLQTDYTATPHRQTPPLGMNGAAPPPSGRGCRYPIWIATQFGSDGSAHARVATQQLRKPTSATDVMFRNAF